MPNLAGHATLRLALLDPAQPKKLLWHAVQMTARVRWAPALLPQVFAAVEGCLQSGSSIVRASCMQALAELTQEAPPGFG